MNKKLNAKIQKLIPSLGENEIIFSSSIAIEPPEKDLILKKGNVYTVFDIRCAYPLNLTLFTNVINDVLFDSYYHSDNVSPIQSLEKAVVTINSKVSSLSTENQTTKEGEQPVQPAPMLEFNILAAVLWGNVLYIVKYGKGKGYLMREGEIKEVSSTSEGNFSVASGVVKADDVVVLSTEDFASKFPPDKLLGTAISSNELGPSQSCLILKFVVDAEFTEDEIIDFNMPKENKTSKLGQMIDGFRNRQNNKEQKVQPITSLSDDVSAPTPSPTPIKQENYQPEIQRPQEPVNLKIKSDRKPKIRLNGKTAMVVIFVLLLLSIVGTVLYKNNTNQNAQNDKDGASSTLTVPKELDKGETPLGETPKPTVNKEQDITNKVSRVSAQPFYDIKLADENANPTEIAVFNSTVVVTDPTSGKIYTSSLTTPKFTALETTFVGIKGIINYDSKLNFVDSTNFKIYDLVTNEISQEFAGTFGIYNVYLGNIYSISGSKLTKYVKADDTLTESVWGEDESFSKVVSMDIAYSVYTIMSDGNVKAYTQGEETSFAIKVIDKPLSNPTKIVADVNYDNIYIADSGNNRIVVIDTDGNFVRQIKTENESEWSNIKSIGVNTDETKMFVLSGSRVFDVNLEDTLKPLETTQAAETEPEQQTTPETDATGDTAQ